LYIVKHIIDKSQKMLNNVSNALTLDAHRQGENGHFVQATKHGLIAVKEMGPTEG
jgi:hypothetical protein